MSLRIAFVGITKDYRELPSDYIEFFNKYHLEIPFYYAESGGMDIDVISDSHQGVSQVFDGGGSFTNVFKNNYSHFKYDIVVHWRSWQEDLYRPDAVNVLHTCDFNYSQQWRETVQKAFAERKLRYVLCYRTWHQRNIHNETGIPLEKLLTDMTLGVDTQIYKPSEKNWHEMLWSSDPGRGLDGALALAIKLFQKDHRFKLHVCYPDYVKNRMPVRHPAIVWHGNIPNGQKLWDLFNTTGILPYTSTFPEPSSRAHRQAQAAGSLVLYPPQTGSPSELIIDGETGFVRPISEWVELIHTSVSDGRAAEIGARARKFAETQTWQVQAENFKNFFIGCKI
jgi:glycosyltransferase involved in cell wall biosynthesis